MILYILAILASLAVVGFSKSRRGVIAGSALFYAIQLVGVVAVILLSLGDTALLFFTFDNLGVTFHILLALISPVVFYQSISYLDSESPREFKIYNLSLMLLCLSVTGVYYANSAPVTWIFLEATTLATAMLVYHRRSIVSLEATWKYIFVSSVGISVAYLGILMLSTAVTGDSGLTYENLAAAVATANPLYLKLAFLFILAGYSCKMEIFPLFSVGVDANYAAPTPASALISSALVNGGFVAFYRVYRMIQLSEIYPWARSVLMIVGVASLLIGAVYLRRTNNLKRFLTYSTVENLGIVMIGLGVGGVAIFGAFFHLVGHSLLKSGMFLQAAQIGRIYGTYHINRIGRYMTIYKLGGAAMILALVGLLAFPPSPLFISELMIFGETIATGRWALLVIVVLLICLVVYTLCRRFTSIAFKEVDVSHLPAVRLDTVATYLQLVLLAIAVALGVFQPDFILQFLKSAL